jgi:hypothetical protein
MSDIPAAIQGTFADFKLVKTRRTVQIVIEVPIEQADQALAALGGLPQPAEEKWVAIARLETKAKVQPLKAETKLSLEAVMRCKDPQFWAFIKDQWYRDIDNEEEAARWVRQFCQIDSRSSLNSDPVAASLWRDLEGRFLVWKRGDAA